MNSRPAWLSYASVLGVLCGACEADIETRSTPEIASATQALSARAAHASCGDHADDEALDTLEMRAQAAHPVVWRSPKPKKSPTVQAKILGFNDFHGQLVEGRRISNRPVGGAAVLASYLRAAQVGFEGRTLIIHAGDHVGASPPESALLQDEPSIQFLNTLANDECEGPTNGDKECNIVGTLGNHEFDEGKDELLRHYV